MIRQILSPYTLRLRLMTLIGTVFFATLIATSVSVYIFTYRAEVETWTDRQGESARAAASTVANFMDKAQGALAAGFILNSNPSEDQQIAENLLGYNPAFFEIIRLDASGNIGAAAFRDQPILANLFTITESQWFRATRAGRVYYGSVQVSAQNEPYLILATPLSNGGAAAGRLRTNILQDVISNVHIGSTGKAYVLNQEGQIIAHTNHQLVLEYVNIANRPEYQAIRQNPGQQWYGTFTNLEGSPVVGVSAKVPGTDWVILTELPEDEAFSNSRNIWWVIGGILLFMILAMAVARSFLIRWVFLPIDKLKEGALALGRGNIQYRIDLKQGDEIGILAEAFDEMAAQVGEQRLVLEQRVQERTVELSQLNTRLLQENEEKSRLYGQVRESLKEKEVLLKEVHHRVKNNLQVISSLLSLQSAQIQDPTTRQLFRDSQNRVRSMALIHEKLYQSHDLARVDFNGYVHSLSTYLVGTFGIETRGVALRTEVATIAMSIDQAIPCGLIINELVSNSLKYAFPNNRTGEVYILFTVDADQRFYLRVGDNGIGFPESIRFENTTSLGLQLVNSLVTQLGGTIELSRAAGTEFRITFGEPEKEMGAAPPQT